MTRRARFLALATSALFALAGCGGGGDEPESRLEPPGGSATGDDLAGPSSPQGGSGGAAPAGPGSGSGPGGGGTGGGGSRGGDPGDGGGEDGRPGSSRGGSGGAAPDPAAGPPDDVSRARRFMDDYLARLRAGDGTVCTELFTRNHVERVTRRKGDAAIAKCRRDIDGKRVDIAMRDLKSVEPIGGGRLKVIATLVSGGRELNSVLELVEDGGRLKIDRGG